MTRTIRLLAATAVTILSLLALTGPAAAQDAGHATSTTTAVSPAGALPSSGSNSIPYPRIGVALLAGGAFITLVVRKRNAAGRD